MKPLCWQGQCYGLLLFDLDGTLVATAPEIAAAVNDTLGELGLPPFAEAELTAWVGHGGRELLLRALAAARHTSPELLRHEPLLDEAVPLFRRHYLARCGSQSAPYPGVVATLQTLKDRGLKLVLLTNKEQPFTDAVLAAHELTPYFDWVIAGDSLPRKKPDPMGIDAARTRFACTPSQSLLIGDSSIDVAAARNAGIAVWAMTYGYNMGQDIALSSPDRLLSRFAAIIDDSDFNHSDQR